MKIINKTEAEKRYIAVDDFVPCAEAFIDRRNPNSEGKLNYSFIGPGVTQSDKQFVNLAEAHGFNVGGVSLPAGRINNLHLHFTAEVFIPTSGEWDFLWGNDGESSARVRGFDVFSIPTWIFRGFANRGNNDAFMFAVLGGNDTGGIVWNPKVLADAEQAGLRLTTNNRVVDLQKGEKIPAGETCMPPITDAEMHKLPQFSPAEMEQFIIRWDNLQWRDDALIGDGELAPILGHGMTLSRHHYPQVAHPHGFSMEWLRLQPGDETGAWQTSRRQVVIAFDGTAEVLLNPHESRSAFALKRHSIFSIPPQATRAFRNHSESEATLLVINGGDERLIPEWDNTALSVARVAGQVIDAGLYLSPDAVINPAA